jgi:prepilin-type processing-associated H-X9-DG protein
MKYVPVDNAYTSSPSDYLDPRLEIDLTGAVDMAIDGNMYVLFADGSVKKFFDGVELPFALTGLPDPMRSPTTLFVSGEQKPDAPGYLYVADAGNERVLQFDKNGAYIRQFMTKPGEPQFRGLRAIYVDEERRRMFVLSGNTLWLTDIPPLGTP